MNEVIVSQSSSNSLAVVSQAEQKFVQSLVVNKTSEDLLDFVKNQVFLACVYRGINKTEEERSIIAQMTTSEIKRRFAYLTTDEIERSFRNYKYGSDFSKTICPEAIISCIEKTNQEATQRVNRSRFEQLNATKSIKKTKAENLEDAKRMIRKDYGYYLEDGSVYNLKNWNYHLITTKLKDYTITLSEAKELMELAELHTCKRIQEKNKYRYRTINSVLKDRKFLQTEEYKNSKKNEFKRLFVGMFFRKLKQGKYKNELFEEIKK